MTGSLGRNDSKGVDAGGPPSRERTTVDPGCPTKRVSSASAGTTKVLLSISNPNECSAGSDGANGVDAAPPAANDGMVPSS